MNLLNRTCAFAALLFVAVACAAGPDETITGRVIGVSDGDTITVLVETASGKTPVKVRLYGVDCPEARQPFGEKAKKFTSELAFDKPATVKIIDTDRYGRKVGVVTVSGTNLNAALVDAGMAWAYVKYSRAFVAREKSAREAKRGLWADKAPVAPWAYRSDSPRPKSPNGPTSPASP